MSAAVASSSSGAPAAAAELPHRPTKTVLVLGASYAGHRAIQQLLTQLPPDWRVVVLERNTHANHLYAFPRVAVVKGHEEKVFIPYSKMFSPGGVDSPGSHALLHGCLISLAPTTPPANSTRPRYGRGIARYLPLTGGATCCRAPTAAAEMMEVRFDYLVYALGSHLPPCINVWSGPGPMPAQQGSELMRPGRCCREQPPADSSRAVPLPRRAKAPCDALPTPPEEASTDAAETTAQGNASVADVATQLQESLVLDPQLPSYDERPPSPPDSRSTSPRHKEALSASKPTANLPPCRGSKTEGVAWLRDAQERICKAASVLVIGGGALGVQFAADIAALYGTPKAPKSATPKQVTLVSSSKKLLPRFDDYLHEETMRRFEALGVDVLLGARADLESMKITADERRVVRTLDGREAAADLVLFCTGQRPNTSFLSTYAASHGLDAVLCERSHMARVNRHLQLGVHAPGSSEEPQVAPGMEHVFVIGDAADAFGALNAGHTAWTQAEVAVRNICTLVERERAAEDAEAAAAAAAKELARYTAPEPNIKVTVGLDCAVFQSSGKVGVKGPEECPLDLNAPSMWTRRGLSQDDMSV